MEEVRKGGEKEDGEESGVRSVLVLVRTEEREVSEVEAETLRGREGVCVEAKEGVRKCKRVEVMRAKWMCAG